MSGLSFSRRSTQAELTDDLTLKGEASIKNMQELEAVNLWLGGKATLISAFNKIYKKCPNLFKDKKTVIADLGCGGGDLLRDIHDWANDKGLSVELVGIDANPATIKCAIKNANGFNNIQFKTANVLSDELKQMRFDIVCLNSFCHHLSDANLIALLKQLQTQTRVAIIINDLHRHWFAYLSIKWLAQLLNFSYLSKHDGPMSVLRAFQKHELVNLLKAANIDRFQIRWRWAFRWGVIIWNK
jgi:2-polyprenyl-3-methyl-5-hydroxy-6-metoxy-1,4-benzoquinol methylase